MGAWLGCSHCQCGSGDKEVLGEPGTSSTSSGGPTASTARSAGADNGTDETDDTTGRAAATATDSTTADATGAGADPNLCHGSNECEPQTYCVAPFADVRRGPFDCMPDCVPAMAEEVWCFDDAACCDPEATCTPRGYCISPPR